MKTRKSELTSKRVAAIAGRVQNIIKRFKHDDETLHVYTGDGVFQALPLRLQDIGALAGSVLTQTTDKPVPPLKLIKRHRPRVRNPRGLKKRRR